MEVREKTKRRNCVERPRRGRRTEARRRRDKRRAKEKKKKAENGATANPFDPEIATRYLLAVPVIDPSL